MKPTESGNWARATQTLVAVGYPLVVLMICLWMGSRGLRAGSIRKLSLTNERPGIVTLALGHTTALSFTTKPDRVVLGAPERLHVDFLGNDVIVTPTGKDPGNLLVYTKASRYVVLFQIGTSSRYDDVVEIHEGSDPSHARVIHPLEDSYSIARLKVIGLSQNPTGIKLPSEITAWISRNGKMLSGEEVTGLIQKAAPIHCSGCLIKKIAGDGACSIVCSSAVDTLHCLGTGQLKFELKRGVQ